MLSHGVFGTLLSGMWHGYRRWASLFNTVSIVLSVMMAVVILRFAVGVRDTINDMVRMEAAAGAVRIHQSGWRPDDSEESFRVAVTRADARLRDMFRAGRYEGFQFWWRSEAHFLMLDHPADREGRGIYTKLGNTLPEDPEAARVRPYVLEGRWVEGGAADQIVLSSQVALKLARHLPGADSVADLVGRSIWITLPGTRDHLPAACAQVTVSGIFEHMRDQACMTTPGVIQKMFARTKANANGKWYETYDRLTYAVLSVSGGGVQGDPDLSGRDIPLVCWRVPGAESRWLALRGKLAAEESAAATNGVLRVVVQPTGRDQTFVLEHARNLAVPASDRMSTEDLDALYPDGYVICSPRVWNDLGFEAAPLVPVGPWQDQAMYGYLYFKNLETATRARDRLAGWGFETYMPIDRFQGLRALARVVTMSALILLATVLLAGLLGIMVTLYTEVDAEEREIGLMKALGASNATIGWVFLGKGALIGALGALIGIPLAGWFGFGINQVISRAVARTAGLASVEEGFFSRDSWMGAVVGATVIALAAVAALLPALQAAGKDPQEALRAE